jgi:PiT family inorganic phosphate transporter
LVPVSSSQAVIGAVIGIGLVKGGKGIKWGVLANIASGWVTTPVVACLVCFVALFFLQNVFNQQVYKDASYELSQPVLDRLERQDVPIQRLTALKDKHFASVRTFRQTLREHVVLNDREESRILASARIDAILINNSKLWLLDNTSLSDEQRASMWKLVGEKYRHTWILDEALAKASPEWKSRPATTVNKVFNRELQAQRGVVYKIFRIEEKQP